MSEHNDEPAGDELAGARERFEQARMTRRQALRKMGLTSGLAIFSMLTIDDLARVSAKKLQEHEASRGIGDALAKEFRGAGVAFAAGPSGFNPSAPNPCLNYHCANDDCICKADRDHCYCVEWAKANNQGCKTMGDATVACAKLGVAVAACDKTRKEACQEING